MALWRQLSLLLCLGNAFGNQWIDYPNEGTATLTHYTLPPGYVAACGCAGDVTKYPAAALSQMAYGSSANWGRWYSIPISGFTQANRRAGLWCLLQVNPGQSCSRKSAFLSQRKERNRCKNSRPVSSVSGWVVLWHGEQDQLVISPRL